MAERRILVLADDLTGALEVGSKFAAAGVNSQVKTGPGLLLPELQNATGAFVVDTETRHAAAAEAARRVHDLAQIARGEAFTCIYKKTDSTLRGNIGAELAALIRACSGSPLLYVPAYPQMGRTVRNGSLYVDGVLVGATSFASDPLNPVIESHIPTMLAAQSNLSVRMTTVANISDCEPGGITICDGETDADVEAAARAFINSPMFRLVAGPAGFATHLARLVDLHRCPPPALPSVGNALIVNGSLHKVSLQQVEHAKREAFGSVDGHAMPATLSDDAWMVLEQGGTTDRATLDFARCLALSVCRLLARFPVDLLVIFGGDTAYAIVEAIGNPPLHPLGEVMEGIPISKIEAKQIGPHVGHRDRDLYVVTKAGGFGPEDVLTTIRKSIGSAGL
jgi:uncharacterized protein YgbK (DUF1537 family)